MNLFTAVELAPRDPIFGLNEAYQADTRPDKVNLTIGVYCDEQGQIPLLSAVNKAKQTILKSNNPHGYLPMDGFANYAKATQNLLFGADSPLLSDKRVVTVQTLGGTGALRVGADFLRVVLGKANIAISNPTWENHRAIFTQAGFTIHDYRYYDAQTRGLNLDGMLEDLKALPTKTVVLLHGCCHNPTGIDLTLDDWKKVIEVVKEKKLVPFIDLAYQGFGDSLDEDAIAVRLFAESGLSFLVSSSYSKSFSLYGERVGALSFVTGTSEESERVMSQVKRVIRTNYSNPPSFGAKLISEVLNSAELFALWGQELQEMRERIKKMRVLMVEGLSNTNQDFSFITKQRGMFSYSGLNPAQVDALRTEYGVYIVGTGRMCVAALNEHNIKTVVHAVSQVI